MAYLAKTDGTRHPIAAPLSLDEARALLHGAYVERVCPKQTPGVIFLCDEDGHAKGLPINDHGCVLYGSGLTGHPIVGDIIVFENRREARGWL